MYPQSSSRILGTRIGLAIVIACSAPPASADDDALLRYHWKPGQTHMYEVKVEADHGQYLDLMTGTPGYTVTATNDDGVAVTFRGGLSRRTQLKPGVRGIIRSRMPSSFSPFTGIGVRSINMTINERGEVVTSAGTTQLPYLLGQLSQLMLEAVPKGNEKNWKTSEDITITISDGFFPRPPTARFEGKQTKATQETSYAIDTINNDTVMINKAFILKTATTVNGMPRIEIAGQGKVTFDKKVGVATKLEFEQKMIFRDDKQTDETPIKISYRLLSEAEKVEIAKAAEAAAKLAKEPLSEIQQKEALEDLTSGEKTRQSRALSLLQSKEPDKANKDIAAATEALLAGADNSMRQRAARALIKWGTKESAPALLKALDDKDFSIRHPAIEALGKLKIDGAAEAIAKRMLETQDRITAGNALKAIGAGAEPAVLKLTEHAEWTMRSDACRILGAIGTAKSVPVLTALQSDENGSVRLLAKKALEEVEKRK